MSDELKFGMDKAPSLLKWLTDLDNNPKSHTESWCDGWNAATNNLAQENADLTAKLKIAVEALEEIHKVASAGCPVGEMPDATFQAISDICAEAKQ